MIIVSQDKSVIVNFSNIVYLDIEKNNFDKYVIEAYYNSKDEEYVWLGEYSTEKRAKEVLEDIKDWYSLKNLGTMDCMQAIGYTLVRRTSVYNMPNE